jgi:hypothetical protein
MEKFYMPIHFFFIPIGNIQLFNRLFKMAYKNNSIYL